MKKKTKNNIIFGLSLLETSGNWHNFVAGLNDMTHFKGLELPGSCFDDPDFQTVMSRKKWYYIHVAQVVANSLARSIAEQSPKMILDFVDTMEKNIRKLKQFHVDSCEVDFSLEYLPENPQLYQPIINLFKRFTPVLHETDIKLCIPARIPWGTEDIHDFLLSFMKDSLCPAARLAVDIYPHRLDNEFDPESLFRWFRLDSVVVRFVYDAAQGNHLLKTSVQPWIKYLKNIGFTGAVVFVPRIADSDTFLKESFLLHQMISELDKS